MLTPTTDQENALSQMAQNRSGGVLIGSEIGSGKTLIVVEHAIRTGARTVLVVCPLGTRIGWERTFKGQGWDLPVLRVESTKAGREAEAALISGDPGVYLIGHSMFRRKVDAWPKRVWDMAVYDEVQDICNRKSQGFARLKKIRAREKIGMSGTFFGNRFQNAWTAPRWLWWDHVGQGTDYTGNRHVDTSFNRWRAKWCDTEYDPFTWDNEKVVGEKKPGAWNAYLPLYIRTEAKLDVEAVKDEIFVDLSKSQRKVYDDLERDALAWLGENPLVANLPITTRIRLRQVTLGDLSFDETDGSITFAPDAKSTKFDALKEFLDNNPDENVLIYTDSRKFAEVVGYRLGLGDKAALWTGKTSQADRERLLDTFGRPGGPQYIVAVIAAMGAGVDGLQNVCHTVVWLSESEDQTLNEQALGRLLRKGQTKNVRSVHIKAENSLDEGIYNRLISTELANRASLQNKEALT